VQRNFKREFCRVFTVRLRLRRTAARKKFFDYFVGICIIRSLVGPPGADVVEVVGWKSGALFSRALGSQVVTIL
jgi:hypothetical protein